MITPVEIRQQTFKRGLRGYDIEEVNAFLAALSHEWEKMSDTNRALREQAERLQAKYDSLKEVETMLHKTLVQAEQTAKNAMDNARQKAEIKLREADMKVQEILRKGMDERNRIEQDVQELSARREELVVQLKLFLHTQLDRLATFETTDASMDAAAQFTKKLLHDSNTADVEESLFGAKENITNGSSRNIFDEIVNEL